MKVVDIQQVNYEEVSFQGLPRMNYNRFPDGTWAEVLPYIGQRKLLKRRSKLLEDLYQEHLKGTIKE